MNICVYCASSSPKDNNLVLEVEKLGKQMARRNMTLIYGGGNVGLMGAVADAVVNNGGTAIGVIPEVLVEWEVAHKGLNELHQTSNMHERKALMEEKSDVFIVLPGGVGTLEEFFEQFTWQQIGVHSKPIYLYNYKNYYAKILEFLKEASDFGLVRNGDLERLNVFADITELLNCIEARTHKTIPIMKL